jgi:hypothetical protein
MTCIPRLSPTVAIGAKCGVFLSATGDDGASGTQDNPVKSFKRAVDLAVVGENVIYACAEEFLGAVELPAGIAVYGGLDCTTMPRSWRYVDDKTKTIVTADPDTIPLTLATGSGTKLSDLMVLAKPATIEGGSSVAVVSDQVKAEFTDCLFEAGDGKDGAAVKKYTTVASPGTAGKNGLDACSSDKVEGGESVSSMCGIPDSSSGQGGQGFSSFGGIGAPGIPGVFMNGGVGDSGNGCTKGKPGAPGAVGLSGSGALGLGAIMKSGFFGVMGIPGVNGTPGQGGGGGGGSKGGTFGNERCTDGSSAGGAAGGSGGSGGCGGLGGKAGNPGGSSIALISLNSSLTFSSVTLKSGLGGKGGNGGDGELGGKPGSPGFGGLVPASPTKLNKGCDGGLGGTGGDGGKGGGGTGGHSIAIAFQGTAPPQSMWSAKTSAAGKGGTSGDAMGAGADGKNAASLMFAP